MNKLLELMTDVPTFSSETKEKSYILPNKEYFVVTPSEFLVYSKDKKCWYCLRTKLVVSGNISDVIDEKGDMHLFVKDKPVTKGKCAFADSLDDILDFYNSGQYIEWLKYFD